MEIKKYKSFGLTHRIQYFSFQLLVEMDGEEKTLHFYFKEDDNGNEMDVRDDGGNQYELNDFDEEIQQHIWDYLTEYVQMEFEDDDWKEKDDLNFI